MEDGKLISYTKKCKIKTMERRIKLDYKEGFGNLNGNT